MSLIACRWRWCSCCLPGGAMSGCQRLAIRRRASCTSRDVERRLQLEERHRLLEIEDGGHRRHPSERSDRDPHRPPPRARLCLAARCRARYIFQTYKLAKVYPPDREVLKDISLSFLLGRQDRRARLQRRRQVVAAADHGGPRQRVPRRRRSSRPARASACSSRSRRSTQTRTCARTCSTASAHLRALVERFNELAANYSDETADEFARLQERDRRRGRLEPRRHDRARDGRAALPARRRAGRDALGRRAPPRGALPPAAQPAGPAAARRADQPPRRRVGRVARAPPRRVQGHRRRRHPRPLLPRQRRRLDPRARPRPGHPLSGQLLGLARAEAGAPRAGRSRRSSPASARSPPSSNGCAPTRRGAAHVEGAPRQLRGAARRRRPRSSSTRSRSTSPPARASATS